MESGLESGLELGLRNVREGVTKKGHDMVRVKPPGAEQAGTGDGVRVGMRPGGCRSQGQAEGGAWWVQVTGL